MSEAPLPSIPYSDFSRPQPTYANRSTNPSLSSDSGRYRDDSDGGDESPSANNSTQFLPTFSTTPRSYRTHPPRGSLNRSPNRRRLMGFGALTAIILIVIAVVVIKKHSDAGMTSSTSSKGGNSAASGGKVVVSVTGGDGSTVTTDSGDTFVYRNAFGGYWHLDPDNPFTSASRANSWTPPLNGSWTWGVDRINGVNLGGWFVLEPFIAPALFQAYPSAGDEWDLTTLMAADGTLQMTLEQHYDTFITEEDIAQIAGAGLNWVRLPIPFWAINTWSDVGVQGDGTSGTEPFLEGVCWKYIVRLFAWARKYGVRVNLDLHTAPGSQNGYNHSGKQGQINFLNGPEYSDVVQMFGILNEPQMSTIGQPQVSAFYLHVHDLVRNITGYGAGNGAYISLHDGFGSISEWSGFLPGSDRLALDTHPYFAFSGAPNDAPIATSEDPGSAGGIWPAQACDAWGPRLTKGDRTDFGVTVAGEFSNGYNDCGLYLTGVNGSQSYGGDCSLWEDASTWNSSVKAGVMQYALASMDALDGIVHSPLWSYQLGLEGGWMPTDPRTAQGKCAAMGADGTQQFGGTFSAWQTGGVGAGTIDPTAINEFGTWPPATIANVGPEELTLMPMYTATGSVATLTYVTPTPNETGSAAAVTATVSFPNGWFDADDTAPGVTAVAGCAYPDAWLALTLPAPTALCTGT
ncbi:glycoside hydrolase superfamily [Mycena haematopus]|nr:glycoside hydrolase superfamily [Mycena haematopus]